MYFDIHFSVTLLNAATNETRTSNPQTKQIASISNPATMWLPLKPTIELTPKTRAILTPIDVSAVHALLIMTNITNTGRRKKKPEIATLRTWVKKVFIGVG